MVVKAIYSSCNYIFNNKKTREYMCLIERTGCAICICAFSPFLLQNRCRSPPLNQFVSKNKLIGGNNSEI